MSDTSSRSALSRDELARAVDPGLVGNVLEPCVSGSRAGKALAAADRVLDLLHRQEPSPSDERVRERVRHLKSGGEYEVLGEAEGQVSAGDHRIWPEDADPSSDGLWARLVHDGTRLVIYREPITGKMWFRFPNEFHDGRFKTISTTPGASTGGEGRGAAFGTGSAGSGQEVEELRKAALEAIQSLRHAAACNFTPEYSGALGVARCDSFYEAYEAVRKLPTPASTVPPSGGATEGLAEFIEWFVKNYPGPDTIIYDPRWHAPKIYRAARLARDTAAREGE